MHITGRVVGRDIECFKIVVIKLNIRPFGNGKSHSLENRTGFLHNLRYRMQFAKLCSSAWKAEISIGNGSLGLSCRCDHFLLLAVGLLKLFF